MSCRTFRFLAALIVVSALALRVFYVLNSATAGDIRGDVNDYVSYAWNLEHGGVFSSSVPGGEQTLPDSYRGPGYPAFIAAIMRLSGPFRLELRDAEADRLQLVAVPSTWILIACLVQSVLGALTVGFGMVLARFWLSRPLSLAAGILVALWPHLIVFCATLLSEILFGFLLAAALVVTCLWQQRRSAVFAFVAGAAFALAYLVNPVVGAFPVVVAILLARGGQYASTAVFLAAFALAPIGWSVRNHVVDVGNRTSLMRAEQNFVEGSWPTYHTAMNSRFSNEISASIMQAIADEEAAFIADPVQGMAEIGTRVTDDPGYYLRWYLFEKPLLLWDWGIRTGASDITFLVTTRNPFDDSPLLRVTKNIFHLLNPWVTALAFLAIVLLPVRRRLLGSPTPFSYILSAGFFLYVTAVHDVFQAEPRYAIPYRTAEIVLAVSSVECVMAFIARRRNPKALPA